MNTKSLAWGAALAAAAFAVAACESPTTNRSGDGGGTAIEDLEDDYPADILRIVKKESSRDGRLTYVLENVSGKLQEDLTYHVEFRFKATSQGAIGIPFETVLSPERELVLLKSDLAKQLTVENPKPGQTMLGAKLAVQSTPPVSAVARDANGPGTFFLNHAIECVGMASPDDIDAGSLWIEVENVSDRPVSELEAKAVFVDQMTHVKGAETKWSAVRDISKRGARARIQFDIAGLGNLRSFSFLVKIRQQSL